MLRSRVLPETFFKLIECLRFGGLAGKQGVADVFRGERPEPPQKNPAALFMPFQSRAGTDTQFAPNFRRN